MQLQRQRLGLLDKLFPIFGFALHGFGLGPWQISAQVRTSL